MVNAKSSVKKRKKISVVFGTRPEAIKLAPIILELKKNPDKFNVSVCVTAQHREMLDQMLNVFKIKPNIDLNLMKRNQSLSEFTSRSLIALDKYCKKEKPDMVLVQGDTTTTLTASLAAFYNKVKIGHVEAGLRTWDKHAPFPEEINRVLTSHLADIHFAPTEWSKNNLIKEGIESSKIFITGNTVIDALEIALKIIKKNPPEIPGLPFSIYDKKFNKDIILITGHRRENFGEGFRNICAAISISANKIPDVLFVYPVHLNPNVRKVVRKYLGRKNNVFLLNPLDYLPFIALMNKAKLILTDSGGIQEEAPSLGKPVLVMRDKTERPEAVDAGTVKMTGTKKETIVNELASLMCNGKKYNKMARTANPYGDGKASRRIVSAIQDWV